MCAKKYTIPKKKNKYFYSNCKYCILTLQNVHTHGRHTNDDAST